MTAAREMLSCVQKQLRARGHDPGRVDGRLDLHSQAVALLFQNARMQEPTAAPLPFLRADTALRWCRTLAAEDRRLAIYRPALRPPDIRAPGPARDLIRATLRDVERFVADRYGLRLTSRIDVAGGVAGPGATALLENIRDQMTARGTFRFWMNREVSRRCSDPDSFGAAMLPGQLYFCWPAPADESNRRMLDWVLPALVAHEFMHHIQAELADDKREVRRTRGVRLWMGPKWMVEGAANLFEAEFLAGRPGHPETDPDRLQREARRRAEPLAHFRAHENLRSESDYDVAHFAVHLLASRHGMRAVFDYWRHLGDGRTWEDAFGAAFGIGLADFEADFDRRYRVDAAAARRYARGAGPDRQPDPRTP